MIKKKIEVISEVFGSLNQMVNFLCSKFCEPTIEYTDQHVVGTILLRDFRLEYFLL